MAGGVKSKLNKHGLSFLATLAFAGGFFGARVFHLLLPDVMVITQGGIHFHHFWYGLMMVGLAGWLGIIYDDERLDRINAVVFGVGVGFIGDEVGLLLTFGDYYSQLTLDFFVAAISSIILVALLTRYWTQIQTSVLRISSRERLSHFGIFLIGFSTIFFAFFILYLGIPLLFAGAFLLLMALSQGKRTQRRAAV